MRKIFFIILLAPISFYAQMNQNNKLPAVLLPSPTSYELTKYGDININEATGIANFSIPIYNFQSGKLTLPITINYSTSGIKVDQIASWVGMNWNLNAGGLITREVRGLPDENAQRVFTDIGTVLNMKSNNLVPNFLNFGLDVVQGGSDYQPDIYNYNINGYTGSFYLDLNNTPKHIKKENEIKIEKTTNGFILFTPNGIKYHFDGIGEKTKAIVSSSPPVKQDPSPTIQTTWFLTKIKNHLGDEINFSYEHQSNYTYFTGFSEVVSVVSPPTPDRSNAINYTTYRNLIYSKKISKISSNRNSTEIIFNATQSRTDLPSEFRLNSLELKNNNELIKKFNLYYNFINSNKQYYGPINGSLLNLPEHFKRMFLTRISETDKNGVALNGKEHSFVYDDSESLPPRMSFSQDLLGYYNGTQNHGYLPDDVNNVNMFSMNGVLKGDRKSNFIYAKKGILKKIIYPTKGFTEIEYEPAIVLETKNNKVTTAFNMNVNNFEGDKIHIKEFTTPYVQKIRLNVNMNVLNRGFDRIHNKIIIEIKNKRTNKVALFSNLSQSRSSNRASTSLDFWTEANQTYQVKMRFSGIFDEIQSSLNFTYQSGEVSITSPVNKSGVRVKRILDKENPTSLPQIKRFFYSKKEDINNLETFNELSAFNFIENEGERTSGVINPYAPNASSYSSYTLFSFKSSSLNHYLLTLPERFLYRVVTTSFGDNFENGGIEKHFELNRTPSNYVLWNNPIPNATNSNFTSLSNGRLKKEVVFKIDKSQIKIVRERELFYKDIDSHIDNFSGRLRFTNLGLGINEIQLLDGVDIESYKLYSRWTSIDSITTKEYYGNNVLINTEKNIYSSNLAGLPDEKRITNNLGDIFKTKYYYTNNLVLVSQHRIEKPIKIEEFKNTVKLSESNIVYHNYEGLYLPKKLQSSKGLESLEDQIIYHSYDNKANPTEVSKKDGAHTVYIWGYHQTQPLAKIENATYAQVQKQVANLQTLSNVDDDRTVDTRNTAGEVTNYIGKEGNLRKALNDLRNSLPNAQVTTYTYDPLVGITSITDPRGQTTYYHYDAFNRLQYVKDNQGNVLSENQYHYKN